jgi:hypothetical protein
MALLLILRPADDHILPHVYMLIVLPDLEKAFEEQSSAGRNAP